jgi:hypothetical protein
MDMKLDWGKAIFIFFVLFLTLAAVFIVFSFKHKNDLVTDDYYEQGAAYSKQFNINKRSVVYTDSIKVEQNDTQLYILLLGKLQENIESYEAHFYYPADKDYDVRITESVTADKILVPLSSLKPGRTILKFSWKMDGEDYYLEKSLFIN